MLIIYSVVLSYITLHCPGLPQSSWVADPYTSFLSGTCRQLEQTQEKRRSRDLRDLREGVRTTLSPQMTPSPGGWTGEEAPEEEDLTLGEQLENATPGEAISRVDSCFTGPSFNSEVCRTLERQYRAIYCSDVAPSPRYSCQQQATEFGKCNSSWIYRESFCLASCDRCGSNCTDEVPPGYAACSPDLCESDLYVGGNTSAAGSEGERDTDGRRANENKTSTGSGPWCLKTCRRCSPDGSPVQGVVELLP